VRSVTSGDSSARCIHPVTRRQYDNPLVRALSLSALSAHRYDEGVTGRPSVR